MTHFNIKKKRELWTQIFCQATYRDNKRAWHSCYFVLDLFLFELECWPVECRDIFVKGKGQNMKCLQTCLCRNINSQFMWSETCTGILAKKQKMVLQPGDDHRSLWTDWCLYGEKYTVEEIPSFHLQQLWNYFSCFIFVQFRGVRDRRR